MILRNIVKYFFVWLFFLFITCINVSHAQTNKLNNLISNGDSILLSDGTGKIFFSKNAETRLVPASIIKVLTSLAAIHYLGSDFRFKTEFYMDNNLNLKIKGFGDPLLISEIVENISLILSNHFKKEKIIINNIILDDSYFSNSVKIPGTILSDQPYDAPNGALCVNFNTVCFKRINNTYVSAETQTPLLPIALKKIQTSSFKNGRIVLSHNKQEYTLYAGEMFLFFLKQHGIKITGNIRTGLVNEKDRLILQYNSKFSIMDVITKLLEYSNNFIANQLFIIIGAKISGQPGTIEKGRLAMLNYAHNILKIKNINIAEGSGISRKNKISAADMHTILYKFQPYRMTMRNIGNEYYKTGTLNGIATRVGYINNGGENISSYVIILNKSEKAMSKILKLVRQIIGNKKN